MFVLFWRLPLTKTWKSWPNLALEFRPQKASAAKYWPNFSFKILPELQLQKIDKALRPKSEQEFNFVAKIQLPNLHQTVINTFPNTNIINCKNINKFWDGIFTRQDRIKKVYLTGVSELVCDKGSQWSDSGLIKIVKISCMLKPSLSKRKKIDLDI